MPTLLVPFLFRFWINYYHLLLYKEKYISSYSEHTKFPNCTRPPHKCFESGWGFKKMKNRDCYFAQKRSGINSVVRATWKYAPCDVFFRVQYWCQVLLTSLYYLLRYYWFCVLVPYAYWNQSLRHQLANLHKKSWISLERENISRKDKHRSSLFWKAFQIS